MVMIGGKNVKPGTLALAGGGLAAAFLLYRHFSSGSSSSSSSSPAGIDPVTGLPYSQDSQIDPATGLTYLAEAQQYGSVAAAEAAVQGNYSATGGNPGYGYVGTAGYPTTNVGTSAAATGGFSSNSQWAQAVEQDLSAIGYAPADVASAVGRYLAALPLTAAQANIIQVAIAEEGPPPQGSYQVIPQPTTSPGPGTGSGSGSAANPVTGLHVTGVTSRHVDIAWQASAGAQSYTVTVNGRVDHSGDNATIDQVNNLKSRSHYTIGVLAEPAAAGAKPATVTVTTK